jgi:hypothetical protein
MSTLDLTWFLKGVPTVDTIRTRAAEMLDESWDDFPGEVTICIGGLMSWRSSGQIDNVKCPKGLELVFALATEWLDLTPKK